MWKNIVETNIMVCVSPESELNLFLHTVFRLERMLTHSSPKRLIKVSLVLIANWHGKPYGKTQRSRPEMT